MLQKRTHSVSLKQHTVEYLRTQTQSFEYTRQVLRTIHDQIEDEIRLLGGNKQLEAIVAALDLPQENGTA